MGCGACPPGAELEPCEGLTMSVGLTDQAIAAWTGRRAVFAFLDHDRRPRRPIDSPDKLAVFNESWLRRQLNSVRNQIINSPAAAGHIL